MLFHDILTVMTRARHMGTDHSEYRALRASGGVERPRTIAAGGVSAVDAEWLQKLHCLVLGILIFGAKSVGPHCRHICRIGWSREDKCWAGDVYRNRTPVEINRSEIRNTPASPMREDMRRRICGLVQCSQNKFVRCATYKSGFGRFPFLWPVRYAYGTIFSISKPIATAD